MITLLQANTPFPSPHLALHEPNGLLAVGATLSPRRLLDAYGKGIFPWFSEGEPILWWSPDPRMVLYPWEFSPAHSLRKVLRNKDYEVRVDTAFEDVLRACSAPRAGQQGTWINEAMIQAYLTLHRSGHAHSFETWSGGALVGGLYGVALGGAFFGESMFSRQTDASKIAFCHLVAHLQLNAFRLLDCQMHTSHLASLGAREVTREEFLASLARCIRLPNRIGTWTLHPSAARDLPWSGAVDMGRNGPEPLPEAGFRG